MEPPLKVKTSSNAGRSHSPPKKSSKGKRPLGWDSRDVEPSISLKKKPGSQLRKGWKLEPISLSLGRLSGDNDFGSVVAALSPSKKRCKNDAPKNMSVKKAKSARAVLAISRRDVQQCISPIEILSDSDDDDISEIPWMPVASTSAVKLEHIQTPSLPVQVSIVPSSQESLVDMQEPVVSINPTSKAAPAMIDLEIDLDLEEDETFLKPVSPLNVPILFEDEDIMVDDDQWGDFEKITMRRSDSLDAGEYNGSQYGDDGEASQFYDSERGLGSDDDILEVRTRKFCKRNLLILPRPSADGS